MIRWLLAPALLALSPATSFCGDPPLPGDLHSLSQSAKGLIEFGIITNKGYVSFAVIEEWKILEVQTKPPITTMLFQIPNSADEGTPDSSNCAVLSFENGEPAAMAGLQGAMKNATENSTNSTYGKWRLYISSGKQEKTSYQKCIAVREFQGATVLVVSSWPQLSKNPAAYDEVMGAVFRAVLDSVKCGLGPKPVREGEILRRPPEAKNNTT